jgi:hypothetical protein
MFIFLSCHPTLFCPCVRWIWRPPSRSLETRSWVLQCFIHQISCSPRFPWYDYDYLSIMFSRVPSKKCGILLWFAPSQSWQCGLCQNHTNEREIKSFTYIHIYIYYHYSYYYYYYLLLFITIITIYYYYLLLLLFLLLLYIYTCTYTWCFYTHQIQPNCSVALAWHAEEATPSPRCIGCSTRPLPLKVLKAPPLKSSDLGEREWVIWFDLYLYYILYILWTKIGKIIMW